MYCIVRIQYCNVMYCISKYSDKVVFLHRSYVPIVCSYSVLVYNLQLFAKNGCLPFFSFFWILFVLYLFNLVDDIMSDANADVIRDITDDVIMHDFISDVSHHTASKTNVLPPPPQGQANQIQTAVHTLWLRNLTCRWHATRGGPVGFSRHPSDVILLLNFCRFQKWHHVALACLSSISHLTLLQKTVKLGRTTTANIVVTWARAGRDLQELVPICLGKRDMELLPAQMCQRM